MSNCQWCSAPLLWAETESGKRMPLNAAQDPAGNVVMVGHTGQYPIVKVFGDPAEIPADKARYKSHFATCTNPGRFRRNRLARSGGRR